MVKLCQPIRHAGFRGLRDEGGAEGGGTDEDERTEARSVLLCLYRLTRDFRGGDGGTDDSEGAEGSRRFSRLGG